MEKLEMLKNLMVMATADGKLADEEIAFLSNRSQRWGITEDEFQATLDFAAEAEATISIPESKSDRLHMLAELVRIMAADGELADIEKSLFALAAAQMGVTDEELTRVLDHVT